MNFHLQVRQDSGWRIRRSVDRMSEEKDVLREAKVTKVKSVFICPDTVWGQLNTWLCHSLSHYFDFGTHRDILDTCLISREVKLSLIMFGQLIVRMRYNMIAILHNFHKHCTKQWMQKMSDASVFVQTGLNHWWWSKNTHNQTFTTGSLNRKMQAFLFSSSCFFSHEFCLGWFHIFIAIKYLW